jgi:hypothetical protein
MTHLSPTATMRRAADVAPAVRALDEFASVHGVGPR